MNINGQKVKEIRERLCLSQEELGERVGLSAGTINRMENGRQGARPKNLRKIAEALGLPVIDLAGTEKTGNE